MPPPQGALRSMPDPSLCQNLFYNVIGSIPAGNVVHDSSLWHIYACFSSFQPTLGHVSSPVIDGIMMHQRCNAMTVIDSGKGRRNAKCEFAMPVHRQRCKGRSLVQLAAL